MQEPARGHDRISESAVCVDVPASRRCRRCGKQIEPGEPALRKESIFCFWCAYVEPQG